MKLRERIGICQWFHYEDYQAVETAVELLKELDVRHLRTGISWADYHRPQGRKWYAWQMEQLRPFDVLLSIWHTPPSLSENGKCNGPPRFLNDYAAFVWQAIREFGDSFSHLELWNEPNNRYKWDFPNCDPDWGKFSSMIQSAAAQAHTDGKPTVLGGMIPVDHHWLHRLERAGALEQIDIIAYHAFPEMWWDEQPNWEWYAHWKGWRQKTEYLRLHVSGRPIWVTETGLSTWDMQQGRTGRHDLQVQMLRDAVRAPVDRLYWYSLIDLAPEREAIEGFHVDENEYHMGLVTSQGERKAAFHVFKELLACDAPRHAHEPPQRLSS
jgi:CDP-paratose 2-epimerase